MNRREIVAGAAVVAAASIIPSIPTNAITYRKVWHFDDIIAAAKAAQARYKTEVESTLDWQYIFREEMTKVFQQWGTFKPWEHMKMIRRLDDGTYEETEIKNMMSDHNFWGECNFAGMGTEGFTLRFRLPDGRAIRTRYSYIPDQFVFEEVDEEEEKLAHQRRVEEEKG